MSHLRLRQVIGWLGILLPFVLLLGGKLSWEISLQPSISAYYHTPMRDVVVGALCAVGVFLIAYRGYPKSYDNVLTNFAGLAAIGIALFPVNESGHKATYQAHLSPQWIGYFHYAFALVFFSLLIYMCLRTFRQGARHATAAKGTRNRIYTVCGLTMAACVVSVPISQVTLPRTAAVFVAEFVALLAFGFSWLVKGKVLLRDAEEGNQEKR